MLGVFRRRTINNEYQKTFNTVFTDFLRNDVCSFLLNVFQEQKQPKRRQSHFQSESAQERRKPRKSMAEQVDEFVPNFEITWYNNINNKIQAAEEKTKTGSAQFFLGGKVPPKKIVLRN